MSTLRIELPTINPRPLAALRRDEKDFIGGFSEPTKMPWLGWSTPADRCRVGSRLRDVPGSVCAHCYARKGNYVWPNVRNTLERRFELLVADPDQWAKDMTHAILQRAACFTPTTEDPWPAFRWHDSGDLQGPWHLEAIANIALATQRARLADGSRRDVRHWLPTREYAVVEEYVGKGGVIPRNLRVRLSAHMVDGPAPTKLARRLGVQVSSVHKHARYRAAHCPAYTQGGRCLDCRTCWGPTFHVTYPAH